MARILIIEDSASHRLTMQRLVTSMGHVALLAEDGQKGVEKAIAEVPDLILLDVVMPEMNGFQVTRRLSADGATAHIPIILVTSKDQQVDEVWGRRQGAQGYITKPINEKKLSAVIAQFVEKVDELKRSLGMHDAPVS